MATGFDRVRQAVYIVVSGDSNRVVTGDVTQSQKLSTAEKVKGISLLQKIFWIVGIVIPLTGLVFGYFQL